VRACIREPSRADNGDLAHVNIVLHADADGACKIRQTRFDDDLPVVTNHHREVGCVQPGLVEQSTSGRTLNGVEPERHAEPRHHVAQLQDSAVTLSGNDPKKFEVRLLLPGPRRQVFGHRAVHHLVVRPWSHDVKIGPPERHGLHCRTARRVVAIYQQHPFGVRMQLVGIDEDIRGSLVHDQQRNPAGWRPLSPATTKALWAATSRP
jgi:hypothetical protein